jgi:hypothetical protein
MGFRGADMAEKDEAKQHTKPQFRIGGPDEALVLLWARGDDPEDIAERFKISLAEVEEAIGRHGHKYKRRSSRRPRRT